MGNGRAGLVFLFLGFCWWKPNGCTLVNVVFSTILYYTVFSENKYSILFYSVEMKYFWTLAGKFPAVFYLMAY